MKALFAIVIIGCILIILILALRIFCDPPNETMAIPHTESIENHYRFQAVKNINNIMIKKEYVSAGIGGGVGVGTGVGNTEIIFHTTKQFIANVPDSAMVFSSVVQLNDHTVSRRYVSASPQEGLLYIYDREVQHPKKWYVEWFTQDSVHFNKGYLIP